MLAPRLGRDDGLLPMERIRFLRLRHQPGRDLHPWPTRYWGTCVVSIGTGVAYTVLSEWYNTTVLRAWAYSDLMPQVWGIGISPVAQWVFVPALSFAILKSARRSKTFSE